MYAIEDFPSKSMSYNAAKSSLKPFSRSHPPPLLNGHKKTRREINFNTKKKLMGLVHWACISLRRRLHQAASFYTCINPLLHASASVMARQRTSRRATLVHWEHLHAMTCGMTIDIHARLLHDVACVTGIAWTLSWQWHVNIPKWMIQLLLLQVLVLCDF